MVKSKLLTPILAGVLGVSVVGSSVGYVLVNKDDDSGSKKSTKEKSKTAVVSPVEKLSDGGSLVPGLSADSTDDLITNAEAAIKGELDFSYDSDLTITFGDKFKELSGVDIGNIALKTTTKQKGDQAAADFTFKYNDNEVASLNTVYDRTTNNVYVQIPQLSGDYLYMNIDDFMAALEDQMGSYADMLGDLNIEDLEQSLDFNTEELAGKFEEYCDAFMSAMPEPTDGKDVSGEIEGYDYSFTTKTYTITGTDFYNMITAVVDKAKDDSTLADFYNQIGGEQQMGMSYSDLINSLAGNLDEVKNSTESLSFDVYYNQDQPAGFSINQGGIVIDLKSVLTEAVTAIDMTVGSGEEAVTFKGSSEYDDGATNGSFVFSSNIEGAKIDAKYTLTNVNENGGTIRFDGSYDDGNQAVSGWVEAITSVTEDTQDITFDVGYNGDSMITVSYKMEKTEASDITVPSGKMYNIADENALEEYFGNCDTETFLANFKSIIGDELYDSLFGSGFDGHDGWIEDDYDWDDDDYSWLDDYDLDENYTGSIKMIQNEEEEKDA